jgi:hypothetical protein
MVSRALQAVIALFRAAETNRLGIHGEFNLRSIRLFEGLLCKDMLRQNV